ncbi:MAG: hypothetical protein IPP98_14150 [Gemmatimonadetes bacterium]|nr:hypothetical protein [Gemmatimonadota bacterium]
MTIPLPALNVQDGITFNTFNTGNVTNSLQHFRVIPTVATSNQFGSIVPLRAQAVSPTNTPNSPFVRVDFWLLLRPTLSPRLASRLPATASWLA